MLSRGWPGLGPHAEPASPDRLHLTDERLQTGDEPVVPCGHADHKRSEHDRGPNDVFDRGESLARGAETTKHRYRTSLVNEARVASVLRLSDGPIGRYRSTGQKISGGRGPSWPRARPSRRVRAWCSSSRSRPCTRTRGCPFSCPAGEPRAR